MWLSGCGRSLVENFSCTLPGGERAGRVAFGVERSASPHVVVLDTTGVDFQDVLDARMERFDRNLNEGLIPVGSSQSREKGQGEPQAAVLAAQHGASVAVVEIRDPPPYEKTIETQVPTLITESIRVDGTANFKGNVTRMGWGPGTSKVWVDPYLVECRLWAKRSWPPLLGVYFTEEMRAFRGHADSPRRPTMKSAVDRWRLRHPGESVPPRGAEVDYIIPGAPAEAIGIRWRDILVSIGGVPISDEAAARSAIGAASGREVSIVLMRQFGSQAEDEAEGWDVATPRNPLFQATDPAPYRQLSQMVLMAARR